MKPTFAYGTLPLGMTRAEAYELSEDVPSNPSAAPTLGEVIGRRFSRRGLIAGALGVTAIGSVLRASPALAQLTSPGTAAAAAPSAFGFAEIAHGVDATHHVSPGHRADILIRWGDPVLPGAPEFDPQNQSAERQEMQFGYNNDYIGYAPLPAGSASADHGLLCVNHEYTNEELMFPGMGGEQALPDVAFSAMTPELVEIEMAAHGCSILEVRRDEQGRWQVVKDSPYARRITARSTPMRVSGPAAGHARLKTSADPTGTRVIGTINNCAGGMTPWGTYLTAEENFHGYFMGTPAADNPEADHYKRYGVPGTWYAWGRVQPRFDVSREPNEPNRFGWIVEIDPYDPTSTPVKRTALGRFKHEGAEAIINPDGRIVVYSGDDERFEYVYKFVSHGRFNPNDRAANRDLLDNGTLFVARFNPDATVSWLPLVWGTGPLTPENGFHSQADVLINTRQAADLMGATPMDRPEDVQPGPAGRAWIMLTNNSRRKSDQIMAANPRPSNAFGHIIEIVAPEGDHARLTARWEILVKCGDPARPGVNASFNPATSADGWFACPDNAAVDGRGRLWVATDQGDNWPLSGTADGLWALATDGPDRGTGRMFFRVPAGAELCGPMFTPDDRTLFAAIQHPGADGTDKLPGFERVSTFEDPATRWPDFQDDMPPRPSVVVITREDGGPIG